MGRTDAHQFVHVRVEVGLALEVQIQVHEVVPDFIQHPF